MTTLRLRSKVNFPATVTASGGFQVVKANGIWTVSPDWTALALETTIPDPEARQLWTYDPNEDTYYRLTVQALIDNLPAGPAGDPGATGATGAGYAATSASSQTIGNSGTKTFTTQSGLAYTAGARVRAADSAAPSTNWMEGVVTSYSSTTLVFTADKSAGSGTLTSWNINLAGQPGADGAGTGDVVGPSSSVDSEIALFSSTTGKLIKRASLTGIVKAASGVASAAVSGTDYAPATSGSAILKGNGSGGFSSATAGTDYYNPGGTDVAVADGGTGASTAAGALTNLGAAGQGKQTIALPKGAWKAKASGGATSSTYQDIDVFSFNGTSATRIRTVIPMPKSWNESTITFKVFGAVDTGGGSGNVAVWKMAAKAFSHDDAAWTTTDLSTGAQAANMSWTADDDILISAESSALTIDGTPAEGDLVMFELWRDPADAADNNTAAFLMISAHIYITTNAANDA